jgi:acyl-CoA reductase-like NAD-dependent aldehyde dehydrogenase
MRLVDPTLLRTRALVGGEWIDADSGATFDVVNPANSNVVAKVANLDVIETRRREEIFGPVAPLLRFSTEDEAIRRANDTPMGLAAYVYTREPTRIWRVSEGIDCGMIGVNTGLISTELAPFGGFKESGLGREGSHDGLDEYLETKYVAIGGI